MAERKRIFECDEAPSVPREIALFLSLPWPAPSCRLVNLLDEAGHAVSKQGMVVGVVESLCLATSPTPGSRPSNLSSSPLSSKAPLSSSPVFRIKTPAGLISPFGGSSVCPHQSHPPLRLSPCAPATLAVFHFLEPEVCSPIPGPLHVLLPSSAWTTMGPLRLTNSGVLP